MAPEPTPNLTLARLLALTLFGLLLWGLLPQPIPATAEQAPTPTAAPAATPPPIATSRPAAPTGRDCNGLGLTAGRRIGASEAMTGTASIGNFIWNDANGNGIQEADEPGLSGVTVALYGDDGSFIRATESDTTAGSYRFEALTPGVAYYMRFLPPSGFRFTPANAGEHDSDSDVDPQTGETPRFILNPDEALFTCDCGLVPDTAGTPTPAADLGDAPDSTNHFGAPMPAYPNGTQGSFPTIFDPSRPRPLGPIHRNPRLRFFLGSEISGEEPDADIGWDEDGPHNLNPPLRIANRDRGDDGLLLPTLWPHCEMMRLDYTVTVAPDTPTNTLAYLNLWYDGSHNGQWGNLFQCPGAIANEWATQNVTVTLPGPGTHRFTTPTFLSFNTQPAAPLWVRVTLSDAPAPFLAGQPPVADGRGPEPGAGAEYPPNGGYFLGETEDYLWFAPASPTPSPTPTPVCPDYSPPPGVGIEDIQALSAVWSLGVGDPGWEPKYDLDGNQQTDLHDIMGIALAWQTSCQD